MRNFFLISLIFILISSCSNYDNPQEMIEKTMNSFYKSLNKRDFETMKLYVSPIMQQKVSYFKNIGDELVVYKSFKVRNIELNGNLAVVELECVDEFDNKIICNWNLVKVDDEWKIDVFDFSSTESLN